MSRWQGIVDRIEHPEGEVTIAVVGKYTSLLDSYKSLGEALRHGGIANHVKVNLQWLDSQIFETAGAIRALEDVHGILVPGGFGERGVSGKIAAVRFAREHKIPYFGICFGMQMAVIEAARHLAGLPQGQFERVWPLRGTGGRPDDRMAAWRAAHPAAGRTAIWAAPCGWVPMNAG